MVTRPKGRHGFEARNDRLPFLYFQGLVWVAAGSFFNMDSVSKEELCERSYEEKWKHWHSKEPCYRRR